MAKHFNTVKSNVWLPYHFSLGPAFNRFFEGLKEEKILGNKCPKCNKVLVPARSFCPECNVDMDEWIELAQEGEVVSWTRAAQEFFGAPAETPFIGALIRLDGTDCNFLHIIPDVGAKLEKGTRVRAVWNEEKKGGMMDIKHFAPVS